MTTSITWELEPHTKKKHEILRRYFQAWLPIMSRWNGRVLYVDGFAGPGRYKNGEKGSPLVVLEAARDHIFQNNSNLLCLFIEEDPRRSAHLAQELASIHPALPGNITYQVITRTFNAALINILAALNEQNKRGAPAFMFIDPFGFSNTPFASIERILSNEKSEVLINFMYEEINRFISHPGLPDNYSALFGTAEWKTVQAIEGPDERRRAIHDIYLRQLRKAAKYVRSFEMLNHRNRTDYFLFFASNALKGLEKMKEAMWAIDKTGTYQFFRLYRFAETAAPVSRTAGLCRLAIENDGEVQG